MHDVFISYKVEEIDEATRVRDYLQKNGIKCWMAPDSITGGASYASEINTAIQNCKAFVLILSPLAQTSIHITREYSLADKHKKPAFPFCIKYCSSFTGDFEYLLSVTQYYTAYENWEKAAEKLLKDLRTKLGIGTQTSTDNGSSFYTDNRTKNDYNNNYNNTSKNTTTEKRPVFDTKPKKQESYVTKSGYSKHCINTFIMGLISFFTYAAASFFIPTVLAFKYAYRAKAQLTEFPELKGRKLLKAGLVLNLISINFLIVGLLAGLSPVVALIALVISIIASVKFMNNYNNK